MYSEGPCGISRPDRRIFLALVVYLYLLPVVLPALGCYFNADDVGNLWYHRFVRAPSEAVSGTVLFFLPYRRPVGGCLYLLLYSVFGLNDPLPYYVTGLILFALNAALLFWLLLRLTNSAPLAVLACSIASVHGAIADIWYNFGTVYELLAFGLMLASFHLYLFYLSARSWRRRAHYAAALALYVLAIGGKEMAVTLPALLAAYEWIYGKCRGKGLLPFVGPCIRLLPFVAVALTAAAGRILANPYETSAYVYHFDVTMLHNLLRYIERLFYQAFDLSQAMLLLALSISLGAGIILRNRHMVFGWLCFIIALSPVVPLPRVSGFFLYIPMAGMGLYLGSFLVDMGSRVWRTVCRIVPAARRFARPAVAAGVLLCLVGLSFLHHARIRTARHEFILLGAERRPFDRQLFSRYPNLPTGAALLIYRHPHTDWALHKTIHLYYAKSESELHVWAPPNLDFDAFRYCVMSAPEYHIFDYEQGKLVELEMSDVVPPR